MKLYRTTFGPVVAQDKSVYLISDESWDQLLAREDLGPYIARRIDEGQLAGSKEPVQLLAPIEGQEVWAAGVTYWRSRQSRGMEESQSAGGGDFYDRVYSAPRPELFFKATAHRVAGTRASACESAKTPAECPRARVDPA